MMPRSIAAVILCILVAPAAGVRAAQATQSSVGARLAVTVSDPSGAVIPGAEVLVMPQDRTGASVPAQARTVKTSEAGVASLDGVAPGRYTVVAMFPGFETTALGDVEVRAGDNRRTVTLPIEKVVEDVVVDRDARSAGLDPRGQAFSTVLTREQIDALPDDPDELEAALRAMAPPGASLRVDGFSGGRLPPKEQIRSIRLPRMDAMAAQFHGGMQGVLHIDVLTRPGGGPIGGSIDFSLRDDALNARNPFTPAKGDEGLRQGGLTLSGGLVPNQSSFSLTVQRGSIFETGSLLAATPDGTRAEAVRQPTERLNVFARFDQALPSNHALVVSFDQNALERRNLGVGGFELGDRAWSDESTTRTLRVSENGPLGRRFFSESRLQIRWSDTEAASSVEAPAIRVLDAFTDGGAQRRGGSHRIEFEAASDLDYVRGNHSLRTGILLEGGRYRADDITNYLGTWTFASLDDYAAGRPSNFTRRLGDPSIAYSNVQVGVYAQDDWRVVPSLLVSYGLRYEAQSLLDDQQNWQPRASVSWSPFEQGGTTVRGGVGLFTEWLGTSTWEQALRFDGTRQQEINVVDPAFDPMDVGAGFRLRPELRRTTEASAAVVSRPEASDPTNRYLIGDGVMLPETLVANVGVDQQVGSSLRMTATYTRREGSRLLRGRNLNTPVNGVRPDPSFANVVEVVGDAETRVDSLSLSVTFIKLDWRQTFAMAYYLRSRAESNATGPFGLPASGDDLASEWGPSAPAHQVGGMFNMRPWRALGVSMNVRRQSGTPYTITTGFDDNSDGVFNDRPAGTPRNSARTASQWDVGLRLSYGFGFGGPRDRSAGGGGGTMVVMSRGGGGMPGSGISGPSDSRYRVEFYVAAQNVTDHANYVGYSGVLTSPFFGQPTNVMNPRKVELGVRFGF